LYKYNICGFNSSFKTIGEKKGKRKGKKEAVLQRLANRKHRLLPVQMFQKIEFL